MHSAWRYQGGSGFRCLAAIAAAGGLHVCGEALHSVAFNHSQQDALHCTPLMHGSSARLGLAASAAGGLHRFRLR
jgi:hypothetical protein